MKLIDAGELINRLRRVQQSLDDKGELRPAGTALFCQGIVNKMPTVDAEPVRHGAWVWKTRHYGGFSKYTGLDEYGLSHTITVDTRCEVPEPYCPYCGKHNEGIHLHYCPNCGAKMDGGDEV